MEIVIGILAVLVGVIGIIGSILPALPGPPLTWVGMLLLYLWGGTNRAGENMSLTLLLIMFGATVVVSILDYIVPLYFKRWDKVCRKGCYGRACIRIICSSSCRNDSWLFSRSFSCRVVLCTQEYWGCLEVCFRFISWLPGRNRP